MVDHAILEHPAKLATSPKFFQNKIRSGVCLQALYCPRQPADRNPSWSPHLPKHLLSEMISDGDTLCVGLAHRAGANPTSMG